MRCGRESAEHPVGLGGLFGTIEEAVAWNWNSWRRRESLRRSFTKGVSGTVQEVWLSLKKLQEVGLEDPAFRGICQ